jgi:hypothetical protein
MFLKICVGRRKQGQPLQLVQGILTRVRRSEGDADVPREHGVGVEPCTLGDIQSDRGSGAHERVHPPTQLRCVLPDPDLSVVAQCPQ